MANPILWLNKLRLITKIPGLQSLQQINDDFFLDFDFKIIRVPKLKNKLAYLEHISAFSILLAYDLLEHPVAPLSGASRPPRGLG